MITDSEIQDLADEMRHDSQIDGWGGVSDALEHYAERLESYKSGVERTVWVGVTIIPSKKVAQMEVFDNEQAAQEYVEYARENAPEGVEVWCEQADTELKTGFEG